MAIHYEKDGHIVTITIDRPEARNSLDLEHFGQLADSWVRFRDDDDAFVAILTGVGDVYCVGADLKSFVPIVTERADKLAAGESTQQVGESQYTMAHSLVAVLRDGAIAARTGERVQALQAGDRGDQRHLRRRRPRDDVEHRPPRRAPTTPGSSSPSRAAASSRAAARRCTARASSRGATPWRCCCSPTASRPQRALRDGAREPRRAARPGDGRGARARRHHLPERPARGARLQAVGEGEHVPRRSRRRSRTR